MKKVLKKVAATLTVLTLVAGMLLGENAGIVNAVDKTGMTDLVHFIGSDRSIDSGTIQNAEMTLNLKLNEKVKDYEKYLMFYAKVTLADEAAVACFQNTHFELANTANDVDEIEWNLEGRTFTVGENEVYLSFVDGRIGGTGGGIDFAENIGFLRVYNTTEEGRSGITFNDLAVVEVLPVVREYAGATPGTAPTANVPEGYVFAGWYADELCNTVLTAATEGTAYAKFVHKAMLEAKAQVRTEDPGLIADCDAITSDISWNCDSGTKTVATGADEVKVGTGAYKLEGVAQVRYHMTLKNAVDISKAEALRFWFYVSNTEQLNGKITVGISDKGAATGEAQWTIPAQRLTVGWNEISLEMADASKTLTSLNFLRIFGGGTASESFVTILDDVRVVDGIPNTGIMINDCDRTSGVTTTTSAVDSTDVKEGWGAYVSNRTDVVRHQFVLSNSVDISGEEYKNGRLHMWLYVEDISVFYNTASNLNTVFVVEISSAGKSNDTYEMQYTRKASTLKSGWNELYFDIASGAPSKDTAIDYSKVNTFRLFTNGNSSTAKIAIDDIRVIPEKMLLSCDTSASTVVTLGQVSALETKDVKEGIGAFENNTASQFRMIANLVNGVDMSAYQNGKLNMWFYVEDKDKLNGNALVIEIGNTATRDEYELQWVIPNAELHSGWNEITKDVAGRNQKADKPFDWTNAKRFTIFLSNGGASSAVVTRVDGIRAVSADLYTAPTITKTADMRFVTTVDSLNYSNVGFKVKVNKEKDLNATTVYTRLYAMGTTNKLITYIPSEVYHAQANYFNACILNNIPESAFGTNITVTPYWTTQDGTQVFGTEKTYTVNTLISAQ